jgi:hypothetical protein
MAESHFAENKAESHAKSSTDEASLFHFDHYAALSHPHGDDDTVSGAKAALPSAAVEKSGSINFAAMKDVQVATTCYWYDDNGNNGYGDCDFNAGTVRKYG